MLSRLDWPFPGSRSPFLLKECCDVDMWISRILTMFTQGTMIKDKVHKSPSLPTNSNTFSDQLQFHYTNQPPPPNRHLDLTKRTAPSSASCSHNARSTGKEPPDYTSIPEYIYPALALSSTTSMHPYMPRSSAAAARVRRPGYGYREISE